MTLIRRLFGAGQAENPACKVLMVCMGNICRSPIAEGIARKAAEDAGLGALVHFDSAGTHAYHAGEAPDPRAQQIALEEGGVDLSAQRARRVRESDFAEFDWILAMDKANLAALERQCPAEQRHKVRLFLSFAREAVGDEVPDPYYGNLDGFREVLRLCQAGAQGLVASLRVSLPKPAQTG